MLYCTDVKHVSHMTSLTLILTVLLLTDYRVDKRKKIT